MKLRMALGSVYWIGLAICLAFVIGMAAPGYADFRYVRSIPAPVIPGQPSVVTGLDFGGPDDPALFAAVKTADGSYFFKLAPSTGEQLKRGVFQGHPPDCQSSPWQVMSCASKKMFSAQDFWVGDQCGDFVNFTWDAGGDIGPGNIVGSMMLPQAPNPVGLCLNYGRGETAWAFLYILDGRHGSIIIYDVLDSAVVDSIPLPDTGARFEPSSIALDRGSIFVSGRCIGTETTWPLLLELTPAGELLEAHGFVDKTVFPQGIAFIGDELYVGDATDRISVFDPISFNNPVPEGDSVVVEAVPGRVETVFDSVSTGGWFSADVLGSDSCPLPPGVEAFTDFYHLRTTAEFDYAAGIGISTGGPLPEGIDARYVRVFARPEGSCPEYRDMTIAPAEPTSLMDTKPLTSSMRTKSEDDEFSFFTLAADHRPPGVVIDIKFQILREAIDADADSIPPSTRARISLLYAQALNRYHLGFPDVAAACADSIATVVRAAPAIPHTYSQANPAHNVAGRLISDAHTLAFSLRFIGGSATVPNAPEAIAGPALAVGPNPSSTGFVIECAGLAKSPGDVRVYSVKGELVRALYAGIPASGNLRLDWNGEGANGERVSPGIYFIVLRVGDRTSLKKVVIER